MPGGGRLTVSTAQVLVAQGSGAAVKVATDLASADWLIEAEKFTVAFVDIGLEAYRSLAAPGRWPPGTP